MPRGLARSTRKWRELAQSNGHDRAVADPTAGGQPDQLEAVLRRAFDLPAGGGMAVRVIPGPSPGSVSVEFSDALTNLLWSLCGGAAAREQVEKVVCGLLNERMAKGRPPGGGSVAEAVAWLRELAVAPGEEDPTAGRWVEPLLGARRALFLPAARAEEGAEEMPYARKKRKGRQFLRGNSLAYANTSDRIQQPRRRSGRSVGLPKFGESDILRKRVPIGSFFQADIPDWTGSSIRKGVPDDDDTCDSQWLGTPLWPVNDVNSLSGMESVGRGRPDLCSCCAPSSPKCIRYHVRMARMQLKSELGHAFKDMGFHNMGEEVANLWSWDQQRVFSTIVRLNPISELKTFWYHALRSFPSKTGQDIASYYFNVHVPRRMSLQTKFPRDCVDSDDDEWSGQVTEALSPNCTEASRQFQ